MHLRVIADRVEVEGKYVIVRASCNVPLEDGKVRNAFRLERALPTLQYLQKREARIIVISHIGRDATDSLRPVYEYLASRMTMIWGGTITDPDFAAKHAALQPGEIIFCENLRQDIREEDNDPELVAAMARYGELYVNDAFAEAHREHASTFGLAQVLPAYAGLTLAEEVNELQKVMVPDHKAVFVLGGAKFETKMPLVEQYLALYDIVFIGGALANDLLKARGHEVGQSLVSDVSLADAPFLRHPKLIIPVDVIVEDGDSVVTKELDEVTATDRIMDVGPATMDLLEVALKGAKTVLWNGPLGNYEAGFTDATEAAATMIAQSSAYSVIGGGDTVAAVEKLGLNEKFGFVSIGGGAMLTLLEHGITPALGKLQDN